MLQPIQICTEIDYTEIVQISAGNRACAPKYSNQLPPIRIEVICVMDNSRSAPSRSRAPDRAPSLQERLRAETDAFEFKALIEGVSTGDLARSTPDRHQACAAAGSTGV